MLLWQIFHLFYSFERRNGNLTIILYGSKGDRLTEKCRLFIDTNCPREFKHGFRIEIERMMLAMESVGLIFLPEGDFGYALYPVHKGNVGIPNYAGFFRRKNPWLKEPEQRKLGDLSIESRIHIFD